MNYAENRPQTETLREALLCSQVCDDNQRITRL